MEIDNISPEKNQSFHMKRFNITKFQITFAHILETEIK